MRQRAGRLVSAVVLFVFVSLPAVSQQAWVNKMSNQPGLHPVILKNGGTVGFGTVIVVNPFKDLTLFIAVNQAGSNPAGLGVDMARHLP
jgi:hypothetical protein